MLALTTFLFCLESGKQLSDSSKLVKSIRIAQCSVKKWVLALNNLLSTPGLLHGGLIWIAFCPSVCLSVCPSVTGPKLLDQNSD